MVRRWDGWSVTHFASGRAGEFGIAIQVSGVFEAQCSETYAATMTLWRRLSRWFDSGALTGRGLPVVPAITIFAACGRERATLQALATVLADAATFGRDWPIPDE